MNIYIYLIISTHTLFTQKPLQNSNKFREIWKKLIIDFLFFLLILVNFLKKYSIITIFLFSQFSPNGCVRGI